MLKTLKRAIEKIPVANSLNRLLILALLTMLLAATAAANIISLGERIYGGKQFADFVSCGSSAGNYAYTCDETGACFPNDSINPGDYCPDNTSDVPLEPR